MKVKEEKQLQVMFLRLSFQKMQISRKLPVNFGKSLGLIQMMERSLFLSFNMFSYIYLASIPNLQVSFSECHERDADAIC